MHNCMTGCIVQLLEHRPRRGRQLHDERARVRDAHAARRELRGRELGRRRGSRPPVRRARPRHDRDRRRDRRADGCRSDGVGRRRGDEGAAARDRRTAPSSARRSATAPSRRASTPGTSAFPHAKGQAIPAWDPRPLKATGVTYCTSPMGADHTAGLIMNPGLTPDQFARRVAGVAARERGLRLLGLLPVPPADPRRHPRVLRRAACGREISREQIADLGWQCLLRRVGVQQARRLQRKGRRALGVPHARIRSGRRAPCSTCRRRSSPPSSRRWRRARTCSPRRLRAERLDAR